MVHVFIINPAYNTKEFADDLRARLERIPDLTYYVFTTGAAGEIQTSGDWRHWISNKNILDNEIQFFWDSFKSGECEVTFTFRASRRGVYPTPPVQAECMYESEVFGRSDGYLFVVK